MEVSLHVAVAENGVIGRDGGLPWRLSTDLRRFKSDTVGKAVVMGRKTWDSIGKALPGRLNVVMSRHPGFRPEGAEVVASLDEALRLVRARGRCMPAAPEACVIGGGQVFAEAMPLADRMHVTHVLADIPGDTFFPPIDPRMWRAVRSTDVPAGERDSHPTRHIVYERLR